MSVLRNVCWAGRRAGAAAGGLGALKIGLIAFAAVAVVGIGAFAATRIASNSVEPQEVAVTDQEEPEVSEAPKEDSQSVEETEGSEGEDSQPDEEAEEEVSFPYSYIFSDMPVAAYEITGLGIGRFESVNGRRIYYDIEGDSWYFGDENEEGMYYDTTSYIKLTPGENTFVLFCMQGDEEGEMYRSVATIHSPSGSSQWEAIQYHSEPFVFQTLDGISNIVRYKVTYNEETYDGNFIGVADPTPWITFSEIYHPDSSQDDTIYVIDVIAYSSEYYPSEGYDEIDDYLARLINAFEELGATDVEEIPVEEALERYNIVVSEGDAD